MKNQPNKLFKSSRSQNIRSEDFHTIVKIHKLFLAKSVLEKKYESIKSGKTRKEREQNRVWWKWWKKDDTVLFTKVWLRSSQKILNVVLGCLDISWNLLNINKFQLYISKWKRLCDLLTFSNCLLFVSTSLLYNIISYLHYAWCNAYI